MTPPVSGPADQACHDLLVRLAGRVPDELLWRLRDWLAADAGPVLGAMLPRSLLRHRVAVTEEERDLLEAAVGEWGASRRLLDAVLPSDATDEAAVTFRPGAGGVDAAALSMLAVVRGHRGCVELREGWRVGGRHEQRVVLVRGAEQPWVLTGTLQRVLRAHGERTPCVEVLPRDGEPPAYHRAVTGGSAPLWRAAA